MRLTVAGLALPAALALGPGLAGADGDRTPSPRPGEDPASTQAVRAIDAGQYLMARLDALCVFGCSEYRDLKQAIEAFERKATSGAR